MIRRPFTLLATSALASVLTLPALAQDSELPVEGPVEQTEAPEDDARDVMEDAAAPAAPDTMAQTARTPCRSRR